MSFDVDLEPVKPKVRWGQRWLGMIAPDAGSTRRIERGRAGSGRAVDALRIEAGSVLIRISDGRGRSHDVRFVIPVLTEDEIEGATEAMTAELRHTAEILDGRLPGPLGDVLLPVEVSTTCTCTDAPPCRHVAQTHHALAIAFDRDPFRLLRLRGWEREEMLRVLRERRGSSGSQSAEAELDLTSPRFARGDLSAIDVHPVPTPEVEQIFEELGPPPGMEDSLVIEKRMREAASLAWKLAAGEGADVADDEALVTELRGQGVATAGSVASALGLDTDVVQETLDRLYSAGQVLRMGQGDAARYRAA